MIRKVERLHVARMRVTGGYLHLLSYSGETNELI